MNRPRALISRAAPAAGSRRNRPEPPENRPLALSRLMNRPLALSRLMNRPLALSRLMNRAVHAAH
jgi:hypothetical protein